MKKIKLFLGSLILLLCQNIIAQNFSSNERRETVEKILNTAINSLPFDSVYNQKRVYFLANELLTKNSQLILKRKKCKVLIFERDKLKKLKKYVVLGDFTLNWNNPIVVRIQFEVIPDNKLLNISLEKVDELWSIKDYLILDN